MAVSRQVSCEAVITSTRIPTDPTSKREIDGRVTSLSSMLPMRFARVFFCFPVTQAYGKSDTVRELRGSKLS